MHINSNIKKILAVIIGVLPFYTFVVIDKIVNNPDISVQGLFLFYLPIAIIALLILLLLNKYFLKQTIKNYNLATHSLLSDVAIMLILLVGSSFIHIVFNLFFRDIFPYQQDNTQVIKVLQQIFGNPFYALIFIGPFLWITQLFIIFSRIFLLKNLWEVNKSKIWIWTVLILSSVLFVLPEIDKSILDILVSFSVILLYSITYLYYRRFYPILMASILNQTIQMLDFWLTWYPPGYPPLASLN